MRLRERNTTMPNRCGTLQHNTQSGAEKPRERESEHTREREREPARWEMFVYFGFTASLSRCRRVASFALEGRVSFIVMMIIIIFIIWNSSSSSFDKRCRSRPACTTSDLITNSRRVKSYVWEHDPFGAWTHDGQVVKPYELTTVPPDWPTYETVRTGK